MTTGTALTVVMDNQDAGVPHNVLLLGGADAGTKLAKTEIVSGVGAGEVLDPAAGPGHLSDSSARCTRT